MLVDTLYHGVLSSIARAFSAPPAEYAPGSADRRDRGRDAGVGVGVTVGVGVARRIECHHA